MKKILFTTLLASYAGLVMAQDIIANNAWARFSVSGMSSSGVFMDLDNYSGKDDVLLSASSPIAKSSEIHETVEVNGVMKMRPLAHGLSLPAGQVTQLQPGKMHIMLLGLKKPLVKGTTIPIRLTFRHAKPVTLNVPVSVAPVTKTDPTMPEHSHMHH
ncbi:copper chaperone PCu(A)C [Snodgrassella sp.]|uniref:copper chaperone PCu(A)C n=1 Tax=Snodgrassella sp. TaxID=2815304 RepID=UPI00258E0DEC|nr:copper chaperone PCu(A)C [Snodgrassella sp.]MCO6525546.1 copper chaperone PCu(A)C [Snodgrassella sp.]